MFTMLLLAGGIMIHQDEATLCFDTKAMHEFCPHVCADLNTGWSGKVELDLIKHNVNCLCLEKEPEDVYREKDF